MKKKQNAQQHERHFSSLKIETYIAGGGDVEFRDRFQREIDGCPDCKRRLQVAEAAKGSADADDHSALFPDDFGGNHSGLHMSMEKSFDVNRYADDLEDD